VTGPGRDDEDAGCATSGSSGWLQRTLSAAVPVGRSARYLRQMSAFAGRRWDHVVMSVSAAQAEAFYQEILRAGQVWAIRDEAGFPAPLTPEGRAMPFWSARSRAVKVIQNVDACEGFEPVKLTLDEWRSRWLPGLAKDGIRVGLNWSGARAVGYDLDPDDVEENLSVRLQVD